MVRFNNLIYLLLTLKSKDLNGFFKTGFFFILGIAITNLISVFVGTPRLVTYTSLVFALILLFVFYWYIQAKSISVDWDLIKDSKERAKTKKNNDASQTIQASKPTPVVTNDEIKKVEVPQDTFNFETTLNATYDGGTKEELANAASRGHEAKVRRMDKMNLR